MAQVDYSLAVDVAGGFRDVKPTADGIAFTADFAAGSHTMVARVTLAVPDGSADLVVGVDLPDLATPIESLWFLPALLPDRKNLAVAVADYSDGHLYPSDMDPFPARWLSADRLDLPMVGLVDPEVGCGYALILETSDDAVVECHPYARGEKTIHAPRMQWLASRGRFAYPRSLLYRFVARGGHVEVAKAYRSYAQDHCLLVTLAEKAKANPNVRRLYGATDVWGGGKAFAEAAHEAGIAQLLVQADLNAKTIRSIDAQGYLCGAYDNYTDVQPIGPDGRVDAQHDRVPEHVVLQADGRRMNAWITYDKKTQFMKRCPRFWLPAAEAVFDRVLSDKPYLSRFIDVTTAEALYECEDPEHPLTRGEKRQCGEQLIAYSSRTRGLVTGGEHGIWWGVPYLHYVEGMMSHNPSFAWPAGHLVRPRAKNEQYNVEVNTWAAYERDGIGHATRIPLWELVFHDCVVTTWYWGDSNDFLVQTDPANWDRKDAFNVLYGTMPMLWANREGGWSTHRDRALRTMREVGAVHRAVAEAEMVSHEWLTPDRTLQRSTFSNGFETAANLGSEPREVTLGGRTFHLSANGFVAVGPGLTIARGQESGSP
jgi:hypothetical protein